MTTGNYLSIYQNDICFPNRIKNFIVNLFSSNIKPFLKKDEN